MNAKVIFCIIVFVGAIIASQPVGINFSVSVENIPDEDGFMVRGYCQNNGDGSFHIVIDESIANSPDGAVVFCHEIGHVVNWDGSEEDADNFANAQGVGYIHDASY